jgi:hypothetical protein
MIIPKLNTLLLLPAAFVLALSSHSASAANHELSTVIIPKDKIGTDWTFIQAEYGVSISYSKITVGDEQFLSIQFANTTNVAIDFVWSMTKNNEPVVITADEMSEAKIQLAPNHSEILDGTYLISMNSSDEFSDFRITLQPTKH